MAGLWQRFFATSTGVFEAKICPFAEYEFFLAHAVNSACSTLVYVCAEAFAFTYWGSRPGGAFGITKGFKHAAVEATQNVSH